MKIEQTTLAASESRHSSLVDRFYSDPTPANAVALAIADARVDGNGTPEFFSALHRAEDQLRSPVHAAAPELYEMLLKYVDQEEQAAPYSSSPMREKSRAILAKAEGRAG